MERLLFTKAILFLFVVRTAQPTKAQSSQENNAKKEVIVVNSPKSHHHAAMLVYGQGEESSGGDSKKDISTLFSNLESLNNLVQTQSEIIRNLGLQVAQFRESLDPRKIEKLYTSSKNNTKDISENKKHVKHLTENISFMTEEAQKQTASGVAMLQTLEQKLAGFEEKARRMVSDLEQKFVKTVRKVDNVENKVNQLKLQPKRPEWPRGHYCILARGRCPAGFRRRHGYLRSVYLYSANGDFIKPAKFGNSWIGCYGNYCGQYGNYIGSINIVACCK